MKKILTLTCAILLVVLLCAVCVACNRTDSNDDGNNNGGNNQYEIAKYTVTFNTLSNYTFENNVLTGVVAGSKIKAPTNDKGEKIIPTKTGYTFQYWTEDGKKEFDFNTQTINKNTTLSAYYSPNEFNHNYVLGATYTYNEDGTITVNEGEYKNLTGYDMTIGADAKVKSVYNSKTNLDCPVAENDTFCFWFYLDKDNKPVRFTALLTSDKDTNVASLYDYTLTYNTSDVLTLYPMFRSTLPVVTLQYLAKDGSVLKESPMRSVDKIAESDKFIPENISGYKFSKWYYETVNSNKETVKNDIKYENAEQTGTRVFAMGDFDNYFEGGTVKIYSKWIKQIAISSVEQYKSVYDVLHKENPTDEEKVAIEEILDADIKFSGTINFGTNVFKPLFDASHVFIGTIDGGENGATISGGTFADTTHASVFGYVGGTLENLTFENITLSIVKDGESYASNVRVGAVATVNSGRIYGVAVKSATFNLNELNKVTVGGIVAVNQGVASDINKGYIGGSTVGSNGGNIVVTTNCTSLIFGGVVGENKASSTIADGKAFVTLNEIRCDAFKIGGVAGTNGGQVSQCEAVVASENNVTATSTAYFGGAVADNAAAVEQVAVKATFGSNGCPAIVGGTLSQSINIGGIVGKNEGYVRNSYVDANLHVILNKSASIVAIGGIVGNNFSGKSQSGTSTTGVGAINYCYSTGTIDVTVDRDTNNVRLYAAGIAGRNSQKAISSCFTLVNIAVDNTANDEAGELKNNDTNTLFLGFGFGSMENNSTVTKCWYAPQNTLSLNGELYTVSVVDGEDVENFAITKTGNLKATDPDSTSSFRSETWFTDNTGFDFKDVWTIEEGNLPTLRFLIK